MSCAICEELDVEVDVSVDIGVWRPRITHLYVDMDGVLCDFVGAALAVHRRRDALDHWPPGEYAIEKVLGITADKFWKEIDLCMAFWPTIWTCPEFAELIAVLNSTAIPWTVATTPSMASVSASGKIQWLQRRFGRDFRRYVLLPDKTLLAQPDVILIDDSDANVTAFRQAGGNAITFPQPWNSLHHIKEPSAKLDHVADALSYLGVFPQ